jgi:predicted secreted protein
VFARLEPVVASLALTLTLVAGIALGAMLIAVRLFGLSWTGAAALYFVIWWTLLFAVLPFGVERSEEMPGHDPGAPSNPRLREKAIVTSVVATAVLALAASLMPLAGL